MSEPKEVTIDPRGLWFIWNGVADGSISRAWLDTLTGDHVQEIRPGLYVPEHMEAILADNPDRFVQLTSAQQLPAHNFAEQCRVMADWLAGRGINVKWQT